MAKTLSLDEVFERVGPFGCYQLCIIFAAGILVLSASVQSLLATFIAAEPDWKCVNESIVCDLNGTYNVGSPEYDFRCSIPRTEWEFTTSFTSVVTEWNLVCTKAVYAAIPASLSLVGFLPGNILFGYTGDKYGRKKTIFLSSVLCSTAGLLGSFSPNFWCLCVARFISGIGAGGVCLVAVVLVVELSGIEYRGTAGVGVQVFWCVGLVLLSLLAFLCRDWKKLSVIAASSGLPVFFLWSFIPESPRWLMLYGKVNATEKLLKKIAKCNKRVVPPEPLEVPKVTWNDSSNSGSFSSLFTTSSRLKTILILWWTWLVAAMVYYGVSISSGSLGGNMYLNFGLNSAVEIPSYFAGIVVMNRLGRKYLVVGGLIGAAISSGICGVLFSPDKTDLVSTACRITLSLIAKSFIAPMFTSLYVFSSEIMPTLIRNIGVGSCSAVGRLGSFSAPFLLLLVHVNPALPYSLMGLFSLVASILCLMLKETKKQPTQDTLEDKPPVTEENVPLLENNTSYQTMA